MTRALNFLKDQSGSATYAGIGTVLGVALIGGLSVDHASGWRENTRLQVSTDAAALAAAANISDQDVALAIAMETVDMNLGDDRLITPTDIEFGYFDTDTGDFVLGADEDGGFNAVRATANRTDDNGTGLPTLMIDLLGLDTLSMSVNSVAGSAIGEGGGLVGCEDASFISENRVNTGGGIDLSGAVCMHGEEGVLTGGGDTYTTEVRYSAVDLDDIVINNYSPSSIDIEELRFERSLDPVILPRLQSMHDEIWAEVSPSCDFSNDDKDVDGTYSGTVFPSFITQGDTADVVCMNNFRTFQPGELEPNTIYLSNAGVQFAGDVHGNNIAIVSKQGIGVGGGPALSFDEVFFFGTQLNLAGNIQWGPDTGACSSDNYSVYVFGLQSLSLGGFNPGTSVINTVGAAPAFRPGGAMSGTGMYFESRDTIQLGGALDIFGCNTPYFSELDLADTSIPDDGVSGSFLLR